MSTRLFLSFIIVCMYACGGDKFVSEKSLNNDEKDKMISEEVLKYMGKEALGDTLKIETYVLSTYDYLKKIYGTSNNKTLWYKNAALTKSGKEFYTELAHSAYYGLDSTLYQFNAIKALQDSIKKEENFTLKSRYIAMSDLLLSNAYFLYATHLAKGYLNPTTMQLEWKKDSLSVDLVKQLEESRDKSFLEKLHALQPSKIEYRYLQTALQNWVSNNSLDDVHFEFADAKKDSAGCWTSIQKALVHWKYVDSASAQIDTNLIKAFKAFQEKHGLDPDAKVGRNSISCLKLSNRDRFYRAALAMEKWRWKEDRDPQLQIRVNIPSFSLNVIRNDSLIVTRRVVTGLPDKKTPQLKAKIKWVTLFPFWHVPHSIASEEIAVALRRDSTYLRRHGYTLFNSNREVVDPKTVQYNKLSKNYFPYRVRQNGGYGNSLGVIQFHFPNKYDVYLHDSPAKSLFKRCTRSFSHGCIRLQDPIEFGTFILNQDKKPKKGEAITVDSVKAWINRRFEQRIYLKRQIPIEVDYISVTSDSLGNISFNFDIYNYDPVYINVMMGGKHKFPKKEEEKKVIETPTAVLPEEKTVTVQ